ncbi:copper homeostasis periplasmic binding protein CopC [Massilia luteola]|uniref:copper homeostasis periplasmic binding protein CopC n=1 Tax=Massilia luteola TaxID=3081751 RepID=UPI002ACBFBD5|nr:copper homeostasis periplasmic binding protein CopC [Massilia sp. Gc5]
MSIKRFLAVCALASAVTSPAFAHATLQSSDPKAGSALGSAPKQVRLKFNEALEPAFSKITLLGTGNKEIPIGGATVDNADPTVMTAPLPPLSAGAYRIRWLAMSHDGHKRKGDVPFTVK